jgi:hypothetical protein
METPTVKTKPNKTTPWRSPRGVTTGKRALDSFRRQKSQQRSPVTPHPPQQSPYPRELAALLSSRIDRYKRICPNIGNNLEQKVGLKPIALNFPSPTFKVHSVENKENELQLLSETSYLESVLLNNEGGNSHDIISENQRIIELIVNLSSNCAQQGSFLQGGNAHMLVEFSKQTALLAKKLQANVHRSNAAAKITQNTDPKQQHMVPMETLQFELELGELKSENEKLRSKIDLYQKQIELMSASRPEELPSDRDEAMQVLKVKLQKSMRQVEEGKELANMLRTALASAIQDRINLEEGNGGTPSQMETASHSLSRPRDDNDVIVDVDDDSLNHPPPQDEGEYDQSLAEEYAILFESHKKEAEKEKNRNLVELVRKSLDDTEEDEERGGGEGGHHSLLDLVYTSGDHLSTDVDYSKLNALSEDQFLSKSSRVAARVKVEDPRARQQTQLSGYFFIFLLNLKF